MKERTLTYSTIFLDSRLLLLCSRISFYTRGAESVIVTSTFMVTVEFWNLAFNHTDFGNGLQVPDPESDCVEERHCGGVRVHLHHTGRR
jgi:hypothetical protein